jgi:hypothetical protein
MPFLLVSALIPGCFEAFCKFLVMRRPLSAACRRRLRARHSRHSGPGGSAPGTFDIVLPVHIDYDTLRQSIMKVIDATPEGGTTIRDVQI